MCVTICLYTGVLCGECEDGYGVSALFSNCVTCNNAFSILIIVLGKSTNHHNIRILDFAIVFMKRGPLLRTSPIRDIVI